MGSLQQDLRQTALTCRGHTRPVTHLAFSELTPDGYFLASACKGQLHIILYIVLWFFTAITLF